MKKWLSKYDWEPLEKVYANIIAPVGCIAGYLYLLYRIAIWLYE